MTSTARSSRQSAKVTQLRKGASLEMVRLACPDSAQASLISESFGLPVIKYDPKSKGAIAYEQLAKEVLDRVEKTIGQGS